MWIILQTVGQSDANLEAKGVGGRDHYLSLPLKFETKGASLIPKRAN